MDIDPIHVLSIVLWNGILNLTIQASKSTQQKP